MVRVNLTQFLILKLDLVGTGLAGSLCGFMTFSIGSYEGGP